MHRSMCFAAAGLMILGMAVPALAQVPAPATADAAKPDPNTIICHVSAPAIGSRLGAKRMCATRVQWESYHHDGRDALTYSQAHTFYERKDPVGHIAG